MTRINRIRQKLDVLKPHYCKIIDESHIHADHINGAIESHFKIEIFSDIFIGKDLLTQHKIIYDLLADELATGLHSLSISTKKLT